MSHREELNTIQLDRVLRSDRVAGPLFLGVFSKDRLPSVIPKYPSGLIVNSDTSRGAGEHWMAVFYNKDRSCEFFDPYGLHPKFYGLLEHLKNTAKRVTWNRVAYQPYYSQACGYYCLIYMLLKSRNISLKKSSVVDLNVVIDSLF